MTHSRRPTNVVCLALLTLALFSGCGPSPKLEQAEVARQEEAKPKAAPEPPPVAERLKASGCVVLQGHTDAVESLAFSPDGNLLAAAGEELDIRLWDVTTGKVRRVLKGHARGTINVAFHPDGTRLASGSYDRTARLWDVSTGRDTILYKGEKTRNDWFPVVAFAPDGKSIAFSYADPGSNDYAHVEVRDLGTGATRRILKDQLGMRVLFRPDGRLLFVGGGSGSVALYAVATGDLNATLPGGGYITRLAVSPDGKTLAVCHADTTKGAMLWDVAAAKFAGALRHPSPPGNVTSVAFSPDGKWLATGGSLGGVDHRVMLWDPATRQPVATLQGHSALVAALAFSPDSKVLASGSLDRTIRLWDVGQALKKGPKK
jgi:WD40 repeat protein